MSRLFASIAALAVLAPLAVGCDSTPAVTPDADVADAHVFPASTLYGPCEINEQCPGEGAICRRPLDGYPGGYCTVPCDDRTPCAADGFQNNQCVQRTGEDTAYCEQLCLAGIDCRGAGAAGYTCLADVTSVGGICIPVCSTDEECGGGAVCDAQSHRCVAPDFTPTGALLGEACTEDADCATGNCILEENSGAPSGWVHGYCISNCVLPAGYNSGTWYSRGDVLPNAGCADDGVCLPYAGTLAAGDLGLCFDGCAADTDCREGYTCRKGFELSSGTYTFTNGVCWPADCQSAGCPDGYTCQAVTTSDGTYYACGAD